MYTFVLVFHVLVCCLLVLVVLMQSGRGGGLTEAFSAAENVFGAKTNIVLVRTTTVLASLFLVTCVSLAYLSAQKEKSLLMNAAAKQETFDPDKIFDEAAKKTETIEINTAPAETAPQPETPAVPDSGEAENN